MRLLDKDLQRELLKVFHYFDFFRHALSEEEVWKYLGVRVHEQAFKINLEHLVKVDEITYQNGYYALRNSSDIISERISNVALNKKRLNQAKLISKLLGNIPFVKGVGISGSLSKNGSKPDSDIDFFLITGKNKVWTVKAVAILLKRLLFFGSHKYLCVNYLLAEDNLALKKKNQFQAIEAITLMPVYGSDVFEQFYTENKWISEYYPNKFPPSFRHASNQNNWLKSLIQRVLKSEIGEKLELMAMKAFKKHGELKYGNNKESSVSYKRNESVYFPNDFEAVVLRNYEKKVSGIFRQHIQAK